MHKQRVVVDAVRSDRALPLCPGRSTLAAGATSAAGTGCLVALVHRVVRVAVFRTTLVPVADSGRRPRRAARRRGRGGVAQVGGAFPVMVSRRDRNFGGLFPGAIDGLFSFFGREIITQNHTVFAKSLSALVLGGGKVCRGGEAALAFYVILRA